MAFSRRKKARGPYDKIVKHAQEFLRQELAPIRADQQAVMAQNEKITEYVRQIWSSVAQRPAEKGQG
ncbi:hypothetical protein [Anaeroselena agilis]|uniref:Uncharacterized protein n=1 Tax=Anaeroselena agilis TaxID=3063788 RepID=A0ABU3P1Q1_9FIRM|nr:hypothetical protein [Selenomonadales bacterium 4137-cl]